MAEITFIVTPMIINILHNILPLILAAKIEVVQTPLILTEDNRTYDFGWKVLVVAPNTNIPAIIIGDRITPHHNITVKNLIVIGNKASQTSEFWRQNPEGYRNNGINVSRVNGVTLSNIWVFAARSGGFCLEYNCENARVINCISINNFYDGFSAYESIQSKYINCISILNNYAGYSFDLQWNDNSLVDCYSLLDRREAIFIRASHNNTINLNYFNPIDNGLLEGENFEVTGSLGREIGMASQNIFVGRNLWTGKSLREIEVVGK